MKNEVLRRYLEIPQTRQEIILEICRDKDVLDIGCIQHDISNVDSEEWLHGQIVKIASLTLGVDYLTSAVFELAQRGYNVIQGDVNIPLSINKKFDVIVVGNLIEHLSNFEGLFNNLNRLLKDDGVVLISTANPFFSEQYFFSAFKNEIIVNPEHTCWLDPCTLDQLSTRFGFETLEVRWVKEKWKLSMGVICKNDRNKFNIFTGKWTFDKTVLMHERFFFYLIELFLPALLSAEKLDRLKKSLGDDITSNIWLIFKGRVFGYYWWFRQLFIPIASINKYELYISLLKKKTITN